MFEKITRGQVHLWCTRIAGSQESALGAEYRSMLAPEETARHSRFVFEKDQWRYLTTRALVRVVLSRYAPVAPQDWEFETNAYGRPSIKNKHPLARPIHFNLSHTSELVVLAISADRTIGIDTEKITQTAPIEVAEQFFSPKEVRDLHALPSSARQKRFWEIWTLKESYIKACGLGLSLPLDRFTFCLTQEQTIGIEFARPVSDSASKWQFWQFMPEPTHLLSICLESIDERNVSFVCRAITPLKSNTTIQLSKIRSPRA